MRSPCLLLVILAGACSAPPVARAPCPTGKTLCGDACVETSSDPVHCGGCEGVCPGGALCAGGTCGCPQGQLACDGGCIDPLASRYHCGASNTCQGVEAGINCSDDAFCSFGSCSCNDATLLACGSRCIDPRIADDHCGATGSCVGAEAGEACPAALHCDAGKCVCPSGLQRCGGACIDPSIDRTHCGASGDCTGAEAGATCTDTQFCNRGACACDDRSLVNCDGTCIDPLTSMSHCGAVADCSGARSGAVCLPVQSCVQGSCENDDPSLAELHVSSGKLVPGFDPAVTDYVYVAAGLEATMTVEARPAMAGASLDLEGVPLEAMASQQTGIQPGLRVTVTVETIHGVSRAYHLSVLEPQLISSPVNDNGYFGTTVALTSDLLAVGAPYSWHPPNAEGEVHIYGRGDGTWPEEETLLPEAPDTMFGQALALEGDLLAVGAPGDAGAVYLFRRSAAGWAKEAHLTAPVPAPGDNFGFGVALSGSTLAVVATADWKPDPPGMLYIYDDGPDGWSLSKSLPTCLTSCRPSRSIVLFGDQLVFGGRDIGDNDGFLRMLTRTSGVWSGTEIQASMTSDHPGDTAGESLATDGITLLSADTTYLTSEGLADESRAGVIHVFSNSSEGWVHQEDFTEDGFVRSDLLGSAVSVSGDRFAAGAPGHTGGETHIYIGDGASWTKQFVLHSPWAVTGTGSSLALHGQTLAVGAPYAAGVLVYELP